MPSIARSAFFTLAVALLAPWLYDRYQALAILFHNLNGKYTPVYDIKSHEILFKDRVRNCEDMLLHEDGGWAMLACDPGRDNWNTVMGTFNLTKPLPSGKLWLYQYTMSNLPEKEQLKPLAFENFPSENDFHPLGLEYSEQDSLIYAVSHAQSGSAIEVFKLDTSAATLKYVQTIKHDLIKAPNSICKPTLPKSSDASSGSFLYVTNDHQFLAKQNLILSKIETFSGLAGGSVVALDLQNPEKSKVVARVPFANGIAQINATTLAVASSSRSGVYFYEIQPDRSLLFKNWARTPAAVDNLSVDSSGVLYLAGHPSALDLMKVSKNRPFCDPESSVEAERKACECTAPTWMAKWTEQEGLRTLYQGGDFCSGTSAVRDVKRGVMFMSGLYEKGILAISE